MIPEAAVATVNWLSSGPVFIPAMAKAAAATRTDAPPPKPFNSATICGMAVIWILRARTAPIAAPMINPATIIS